MKQVGDMKLYSLEEVKDELVGKVGTSERDEYEREVDEALRELKTVIAGEKQLGTLDSLIDEL